jgi:hypothetical protein
MKRRIRGESNTPRCAAAALGQSHIPTSLPAAEVVDIGGKSGTEVGVCGSSKERIELACV